MIDRTAGNTISALSVGSLSHARSAEQWVATAGSDQSYYRRLYICERFPHPWVVSIVTK